MTKNEIVDYSENVAIPLIIKVKEQLNALTDMINSDTTTRRQLHAHIRFIGDTLPDIDLMVVTQLKKKKR